MKRTLIVLGILLLSAGCGRESSEPRSAAGPAEQAGGRAVMAGAPAWQADKAVARVAGVVGGVAGVAQSVQPGGTGAPPPVAVPTDRKVIRNGTLELEVKKLDEALRRIRTETEKSGGYVTNESQGRDVYNVRSGSITCRLPAGKLDEALALFQSLGRADAVNVSAEDITEQYFNQEIRLRNQGQLEERLLKLLDKPGNKVSDLVEVEREVSRVRGDIDEMEGRKRFWDNQVAFSTLTVQLHEPRPTIAGGGGGVFDTLKRAFRQAGENLVDTVAWLVAALGVVLPVWLALWLLWRGWRAVRARRRQ